MTGPIETAARTRRSGPMADLYTPTTMEHRRIIADAYGELAAFAFDRWLAAHDAEVRAEGEREALLAAADDAGSRWPRLVTFPNWLRARAQDVTR